MLFALKCSQENRCVRLLFLTTLAEAACCSLSSQAGSTVAVEAFLGPPTPPQQGLLTVLGVQSTRGARGAGTLSQGTTPSALASAPLSDEETGSEVAPSLHRQYVIPGLCHLTGIPEVSSKTYI